MWEDVVATGSSALTNVVDRTDRIAPHRLVFKDQPAVTWRKVLEVSSTSGFACTPGFVCLRLNDKLG